MVKDYVLDTNILIHDPNSIFKFEEHTVVIPHPVIEELDGLKNASGETGYNARQAVRNIIAVGRQGDLSKGVTLENGGTLKLYSTDWLQLGDLPCGWDTRKMDNLILLTVQAIETIRLEEQKANAKGIKDIGVILVSNDVNMQIKAQIMGITVQEYKNDRISGDKMYSGRSIRHLNNADIDTFVKEGRIEASKLYQEDGLDELVRNEYVTLLSWEGSSFLAQYDGKYLNRLDEDICSSWLEARNAGQRFLQNSLMKSHEEKPLTIGCGPAGTGKTLYALACGLEQVIEQKKYKRVLLCRANVMMDEEIGFLPGTEQEKISPLLRGAYDNLEIIFGNEEDSPKQIEDKVKELFQRGHIMAQSLGYLRGRSISDTYIIIDEAQNCTPNQILSIITRVGINTKIVLLGDPNQIDNSRLDKRNNGLVYAKEHMKGSKLCDVISFTEEECTRSALAKEAADKLKR